MLDARFDELDLTLNLRQFLIQLCELETSAAVKVVQQGGN